MDDGLVTLISRRAVKDLADALVEAVGSAGMTVFARVDYAAHAEAAGLVLGARAPVMLTSRADNDRARLGSSALALLYDHWRESGKPYSAAGALARAGE